MPGDRGHTVPAVNDLLGHARPEARDAPTAADGPVARRGVPLAERMRPACLAEVAGQAHVLAGDDAPLRRLLESGGLSLVLWGPPGTGKTTLARLAAVRRGEAFCALSAVTATVRDVRDVIEDSIRAQRLGKPRTLLFLDEIHRFNKAQQDALLPAVESGQIALIGATTENPSFSLNDALLSRLRVFQLRRLDEAALATLIRRAWVDAARGLGRDPAHLPDDTVGTLARHADGDARRALTALEALAAVVPPGQTVVADRLAAWLGDARLRFDRHGDLWHELISALHKAVRGSDPDAALYWLARMLDGGCPPEYLARRLVRMAYEDVGLAAPRLADEALTAWQTVERLGRPEGELALAQIAVRLALAPKSNAVYRAWQAAQRSVPRIGSAPVPAHLINAVTRLDRESGRGQGYQYDHDHPDGVAWSQTHWPEGVAPETFLEPAERERDAAWAQRLAWLREGRKTT